MNFSAFFSRRPAVFLFSVVLFGAPGPAGAQDESGGAPPGGGSYESDTVLTLVDRVFNVESDSLDPEEGVLNWKGRSFQLGQGRMMRARFVRYLNTPVDTMDSRLYLSLLKQIRERLSLLDRASGPVDPDDPWKPVISAWKLLFQAGEFDVDGGSSHVIANLVYDNWRDRELFQNTRFREEVEAAERERMEDEAILETRLEDRRRISSADDIGDLREQGVATPSIDGTGFSPLAQAMKRLTEQEANLAAQGLRMEEIALKARLKMQSQIIAFLSQRRFEHALILASFYRTLFKSSAQDLEVDGEQLISYLPELELIPTVDSLEYIARQALDDVRTGMTSVENAYEQGQLISALERLQETFFLGEYSLSVILFPEEKKRVLRDLYFDLDQARRLAELKDFDALEDLVASIASVADDFPRREALSSIRVAKQASRMKLLAAIRAYTQSDVGAAEELLDEASAKVMAAMTEVSEPDQARELLEETFRKLNDAKKVLSQGNSAGAEALMEESFEIWPFNPDFERFMSGADLVGDFDVDFAGGDYRRIFERREEYIAALAGDKARAARLREVIKTVQSIEFAISAAEERLGRGEPYAAWEMLKEVEETAGDDRRYHRTLSTVVPQIAPFVAAVEEAERLEAAGNHAAALTKLAAASELFPASRFVSRGMERLSREMLDQARRVGAGQL